MTIAKVYAAVCTADLVAAEAWYTRLFGRAPDLSPMPEVHEWHHDRVAGLQVLADTSQAGHSKLTLIVDDIERTRTALSAQGLTLGTSSGGDFATVAQIVDRDGNIIKFAQPGPAAATA
jgi:predicted enzyme related to lactoylglutathione lyase